MKYLLYFYRTYTKYLSNEVWWLLALTILVAFADGLGIAMLLPLLNTLEVSERSGDPTIIERITTTLGITGSLVGILAFMFAVFVGKAILKFGAGYYKARLYKDLYRYLKIKFYDATLKVNYQYFTKRNTGHFVTIMETHVNRMVRSFDLFIILVTATVMALSYLIIAGLISWEVSVMAVLMGTIIFGLLSAINRFVRRLSRRISAEEKHMNQVAVQALHAFKYIVSTASYRPIQEQYNKSIEKITLLQFKTKLANAFTASLQELLSVTLLIGMIIIEVVILGYPIGSVFVILLLFYRGVNQMMAVIQNWQELIAFHGYVVSVDEELDALSVHQVYEGNEKMKTSHNQAPLKFSGVKFSFQDADQPVINNLSLTIKPNTTIAIVGPSGSGKTTVVDLLTGLLHPQEGEITLGDQALQNIQLDDWRASIGYVAQDLTIFDDSVANNISLFKDNIDISDVISAAKLASAHQFIEELPEGYYTRIGDKGVRLSGGQKQRLFIARELFKKPDLLILDEATSALDSESERFIKESIDQLQGKVTVVVIAHRLSTIKDVDQIYVLEQGQIVESGTYEDLIGGGRSKFSDMVELQNL